MCIEKESFFFFFRPGPWTTYGTYQTTSLTSTTRNHSKRRQAFSTRKRTKSSRWSKDIRRSTVASDSKRRKSRIRTRRSRLPVCLAQVHSMEERIELLRKTPFPSDSGFKNYKHGRVFIFVLR